MLIIIFVKISVFTKIAGEYQQSLLTDWQHSLQGIHLNIYT